MTDKKDRSDQPRLKDEFADVSTIDAACALEEMRSGTRPDRDVLRQYYEGADDDSILRITDTLRLRRYDWMDEPRHSVAALMALVPLKLQAIVLDLAIESAEERLEHIHQLKIGGFTVDTLADSEPSEDMSRFPEYYDVSPEAEEKTKLALQEIRTLRAEHKAYISRIINSFETPRPKQG